MFAGVGGGGWSCAAPPAPTPEFMAVTFFWPLLLQVTSDLSQVFNFVLQGFNLRGQQKN